MNKLPVLVLAFNRADNVAEVMKVVREYKPDRLYLECDGPRFGKAGEKEAVIQTRKTMLDAVDWPCKVFTLFRDENLGCANAVNGAISWLFEHEEYGVILEDDVIVSQDFFKLCEALLPYYSNNGKVMQIAALNPVTDCKVTNSYSFNSVTRIWGWATWKRAWSCMDMEMKQWPKFNKWRLIKDFGLFQGMMRWFYYWGRTYKHLDRSTSWATRWFFSCYINGGLSICANVNLAKNIGMTDGTHYSKNDEILYDLNFGTVCFPLEFRTDVVADKELEQLEKKDFRRIRFAGLKKKIRVKI